MRANGGARFFDVGIRRNAALPPHKTPAADERGDGDVERAVCFAAERESAFEKLEHFDGNTDRLFGGARVEVGDFAGAFVEAEHRFNAGNFSESFFTRGAQAWRIAVEHELKARRHRLQSQSDHGRIGGRRLTAKPSKCTGESKFNMANAPMKNERVRTSRQRYLRFVDDYKHGRLD